MKQGDATLLTSSAEWARPQPETSSWLKVMNKMTMSYTWVMGNVPSMSLMLISEHPSTLWLPSEYHCQLLGRRELSDDTIIILVLKTKLILKLILNYQYKIIIFKSVFLLLNQFLTILILFFLLLQNPIGVHIEYFIFLLLSPWISFCECSLLQS